MPQRVAAGNSGHSPTTRRPDIPLLGLLSVRRGTSGGSCVQVIIEDGGLSRGPALQPDIRFLELLIDGETLTRPPTRGSLVGTPQELLR